MDKNFLVSEQRLSGILLIISSIVFLVAATLFTIRVIWGLPMGGTPAYYRWERGFVIAALLIAVLGLTLLKGILENVGDSILAPMGLVLFFAAAVLAVVAETVSLNRQEIIYPTIVVFVILAFLGQAFFGLALLRTGLLPAWVGWTTVIWNLAWLVILPINRPQDMYYPWLHYVVPLLIGIALLIKR